AAAHEQKNPEWMLDLEVPDAESPRIHTVTSEDRQRRTNQSDHSVVDNAAEGRKRYALQPAGTELIDEPRRDEAGNSENDSRQLSARAMREHLAVEDETESNEEEL